MSLPISSTSLHKSLPTPAAPPIVNTGRTDKKIREERQAILSNAAVPSPWGAISTKAPTEIDQNFPSLKAASESTAQQRAISNIFENLRD